MNFKGDHNFNDNNRLTGRYSHARSNGTNPNLFGEGNPAYFTRRTEARTDALDGGRLHARAERDYPVLVPLRT